MKQRYLFLCLLLLLASGAYSQPALIPYRLYTKWGFADMTGKLVIPAKYDMVMPYRGQCAIVKIKGKYGLIDGAGKMLLPPAYDDLNNIKWKGKTWYTLTAGKKQGLADQTGKLILPVKYDELRLSGGPYIAAFTKTTYVTVTPDGTVANAAGSDGQDEGTIGMSIGGSIGNERESGGAMVAQAPYKGFFGPFTLNNKIGYLMSKRTRAGFDTIPAIYDAIDDNYQYQNILWAKKDGLWGVIDPKNNIIFPFLYEEMGSFSVTSNLYSGKKNGKCGILKPDGEVLVPFEWDDLSFANEGSWCRVYKNKKAGIFILDGSTPIFIPARYTKVLGNPAEVIEYNGRKLRFFDVETEKGYGYVGEDGTEYFKDK